MYQRNIWLLPTTQITRDENSNTTNFFEWAVELLANFKSIVQEDTTVRATQKPQRSVLSSTEKNFQS